MKGMRAPGASFLRAALLLAALVLVLLLARATLARSGAGYDLSWWTVDGGGGMGNQGGMHSASGAVSLDGTAGQPDAGLVGGGDYALAGGFFPGGEVFAAQRFLYLPLVFRVF